MEENSWPVLGFSHVTLKDFVRFWDQFPSDYDEKVYRENIGPPSTAERITALFTWKNGRPLSAKKIKSIRPYISAEPEELIGNNANPGMLTAFLNRPGGAIWRIFWLHMQHPGQFPIYDQHVHRAMAFILKSPDFKIPAHNPTKVRTYLEVYRPFFFNHFAEYNHRQVDRALWSFGRFLISEYGRVIQSPQND